MAKHGNPKDSLPFLKDKLASELAKEMAKGGPYKLPKSYYDTFEWRFEPIPPYGAQPYVIEKITVPIDEPLHHKTEGMNVEVIPDGFDRDEYTLSEVRMHVDHLPYVNFVSCKICQEIRWHLMITCCETCNRRAIEEMESLR